MTHPAEREVARLTAHLHSLQKHPDYRYSITFAGNHAHTSRDGWEPNPHVEQTERLWPVIQVYWMRRTAEALARAAEVVITPSVAGFDGLYTQAASVQAALYLPRPGKSYGMTTGRKYARIYQTTGGPNSPGRQVEFFVELETGRCLRDDGWKRPNLGGGFGLSDQERAAWVAAVPGLLAVLTPGS